MLALLNDSSEWPIFVHCRRGADRTGTAIACYRIAHDHWSNQQALAEAKTLGMSSLEIGMQRYILHFAAPASDTASGTR
jgi:protein tyrosine/serine phosphatase